MKFAHEFKETLERECFPDHWLAAAIPYSQLKKCLKKVQRELESLGLDKETLQQLLAEQTVSPNGEPIPLVRYNLDHASSRSLRPCLSIFVHLRHGQVIDAALSPASRAFLQRLSGAHSRPSAIDSSACTTPLATPSPDVSSDDNDEDTEGELERIEVPLVFDGEFFNILQTDVDSLDALQQQEEKSMEAEIKSLGAEVSAVVGPPKRLAKSDLNRWREIFDLYVNAQVFFSSHELDHGSRSSVKAVQQLVWFQKQVQTRGLLQSFKVPSSAVAYSRFLQLNATLLQNLKFQEINKTAITKILKKFDKRTSLGASVTFRSAIRSRNFLAGSVAKKLCAQLSQEVVSTVPRAEDYDCPICFSIAWYPVRLRCSHLFCVRCVIKMQRENKKHCPLCRDEGVMNADLNNIDKSLEKFMKQYFRKETEEKQRANEIERGMEIFGDQYKHSSCVLM
ncbi:SPX domain-domain-containing protein [Coniella lustricola]|uniref:SPX domain-domain-containing protein n=1 Tax=Coniella lustricola TaxID=2025994 RepID=A0A2T3A820_9PEZI|nr:SPX domain-domain-containing protein [Coniella lustricola]